MMRNKFWASLFQYGGTYCAVIATIRLDDEKYLIGTLASLLSVFYFMKMREEDSK
jgi:hypothetical protein